MRNSFVPSALLILTALACLPPGLAAQKRRASGVARVTPVVVKAVGAVETPAERRMSAFETAWSTLNIKYFDRNFGGLDWKQLREEFRPRVRAARTDQEFHALLQEMIDRLGRSHLVVITPDYFEGLETAKKQAREHGERMAAERRSRSGDPDEAEVDDDAFDDAANLRYGIGVELKMLGDKFVITNVEAQSGAAVAGLKPGHTIEKINGVPLQEIVDKARVAGATARDIRYMLPPSIVELFLDGGPDTSVFLTCLDEADKLKEFTVPRLALAGEVISFGANFPEQFLTYEARSLDADTGYIKFNAFAVPVIGKFCDSLTAFGNKKAIIVDLRGNFGGILGSMIGLSGMLTDKSLVLGKFISRDGPQAFTASSKAKNFKGKLIVLVDGQSMSAAEMFTAGLQTNHRAIVVGEQTGGKSLPAVWTKLSTGAVLMYPVADFVTLNGTSLEGKGVAPDQSVALDRSALLNGVDTQLQKAVAIIADDAAFTALNPRPPTPKSGEGSGISSAAPPPPVARAPVKVKSPAPAPSDERSLKIIADFTSAVGGADAIKKITSYEAKGAMELGGSSGNTGTIYAAREFPDRSMMVLTTPILGEVREIYNGKRSFLQADYGLDSSPFMGRDTSREHLLAPVFNILDGEYVKGLKYEGEYSIEGRMRQAVTASVDGYSIGLSFDKQTKMLVTIALPGAFFTLGDYRSTGGVTLPYHIDMEGMLNVHLDTLTINPKLDPGTFEKKEKCFDKAN